MNPQIKIEHNIGNTLEIPNLLDIKASTYVSSNIAAGVLAAPVDNSTEFTAGSILLLLSSLGSENSEIVTSTSHTTESFVTLATVMAHTRGDSVNEIKYDQIVVSKSSTVDGTYTVLATQTFFTTQQKTVIYDTVGLKTDFYKVQWKNSLTSALSDYSTAMSVTSYPENSPAKIIFPVLRAMGVSEDDKKITTEFCLSAIDDARKFTEAKLYGVRHAWQQEFEHPIQILAGSNYVALPDNIDFSDTDRSVLAARFLVNNIIAPFNLNYVDKKNWNQVSSSISGGTTTVEAGIGAVSITMESVGDFPNTAAGTASIATTAFDEDIEQIAYTSIDLVTNQLLGVTGITRVIPIGTRVWAMPTISQPIYYTVYDNKLYFDRVVPDSMQGNNLYIDYYKKTEEVTNLYQELPEHYREMYKWYLRYAIKYRKDITLESNDPDLKKFESLVKALAGNLYTGQETTIITS